MLRATLAVTLLLFATTIAIDVAAPTAQASACNPNFPGADVTCAVYDDVNRLCEKKFGSACFE
jgi:hypothetical protein